MFSCIRIRKHTSIYQLFKIYNSSTNTPMTHCIYMYTYIYIYIYGVCVVCVCVCEYLKAMDGFLLIFNFVLCSTKYILLIGRLL